ncbi:hypothetical protein L228DRAFT_283189, partial [Xylona heveae TC161]
MAWPYHLADLSPDQLHQRRILLDRYGIYAQLSVLIPVLGYQLFRFGGWVYSTRKKLPVVYSTIPNSSIEKPSRKLTSEAITRRWKSVVWCLNGEVAPNLGFRKHWIAAAAWTLWLLFLCICETGQDYLHVTKRFGVVASSQLPVHYMLSMKSRYSPIAFAFNTSHEQLNPWHRFSGGIIYFLLLCHATWYMNFFIQARVLSQRLSSLSSITGILAITLLTILASTSLQRVRRWSYRAFYNSHLAIGLSILPIIFFHAKSLRLYAIEALALFVADRFCRKLDTVTGFATIMHVPHTKLLKVKIPIPASKLSRFRAMPGQHVYLSIPPESAVAAKSSPFTHSHLANPFSVAEVSETDITLVLRARGGPTTHALCNLANPLMAKSPISIEGPYGSSRQFATLSMEFDRILLVAGGIGGTFILPIFYALQDNIDAEDKGADRVTFTWSMKSVAEIGWLNDLEEGQPLVQNKNVKIHLTQNDSLTSSFNDAVSAADGSIEMQILHDLAEVENGRPDLKKLVDDIFNSTSQQQVAVLFCGPLEMGRELRTYIG